MRKGGLGDLDAAHFQADKEDALTERDRHVIADVQRHGGLAHAGPCREDDELPGLEARRDIVEVHQARGDAGDRVAIGGAAADPVHRLFQHELDPETFLPHLVLGDVEDLALGRF